MWGVTALPAIARSDLWSACIMDSSDTIFALSSGRLPAAIAVVRVSGPRAGHVLAALVRKMPAAREAMLARLREPADGATSGESVGEPIDDALVLWFPAPKSETGEDTVEFHLHGGRAVVAALVRALGAMEGLRPAEPGEFTRRSFANGKLDLTGVEGLADLIGAETEAQRRQAFRQLRGLLGEQAESWRTRLISALALVEAVIDFPDEGDVPHDLVAPARDIARELYDEIGALLDDRHRGERLRDGPVVAIAGPVNVGKSSIINLLAGRSAAIVSPHAGTTRDVIEVHLDLGGYPLTVLDTAGLRDSADPVEQEGVRRARERAGEADLVLWVVDAAAAGSVLPPADFGDRMPETWVVFNKCDIAQHGCGKAAEYRGRKWLELSAKTGQNFDKLLKMLEEYLSANFPTNHSVLITRARHRHLLENCRQSLGRMLAEPEGREDIIAEELRLAARDLGRLTGRVDVEDVLDVIFRDFCIGK
jgi:tRNA modification GTPase